MRGPVLFLITSFAASVIAAPVPTSTDSPIEAIELLARSVSEPVAKPVLELAKRMLLERLEDTVAVRRGVSESDQGKEQNDHNDNDDNDDIGQAEVESGQPLEKRDAGSNIAANLRDEGAEILDKRDPVRSSMYGSTYKPGVPISANEKREARNTGAAGHMNGKVKREARNTGAEGNMNGKVKREARNTGAAGHMNGKVKREARNTGAEGNMNGKVKREARNTGAEGNMNGKVKREARNTGAAGHMNGKV